MKRPIKCLLLSGFVCALATTMAPAQTNRILVDEFGGGRRVTTNGTSSFLGVLGPDPSGGLLNWNVLIYTLPFLGTKGDVLMENPLASGNPIHDVIRFDGASHLIFYSDSVDGYHSPADTPGPPDPFYTNITLITEQGPLYFRFADYVPALNEPGWDGSMPSYEFISEGVVPEPSSALLLLGGLGLLGMARLRQGAGFARIANQRSVPEP